MTPTEEVFRLAGETPIDAWFLSHPYFVMLTPLILCGIMTAYVLWATDPYSRFLVRVCSWHEGGPIPHLMVRHPRLGRLMLAVMIWLRQTIRLPVDFTHGTCPSCASRLMDQMDKILDEVKSTRAQED